jgi:DNA-binding NtrC family response regulator
MIREKKYILTVDDSPNILELIRRNLNSKGYIVYTVSNVMEAIKVLESTTIHLVITDLMIPDINGIELVRHVKENYKNTDILVITGHATIKNAVESVKLGADEFIVKTFTDQELFDAVKNALEKQKKREISNHQSEKHLPLETGLIGGSKGMIKIYNDISKASKLRATVLLTGETGTGKELVARAIHYNSPRASSPFVAVNCGGIPEELIESELFGYLKGSFSGAYETRSGFFQTADKGTIFLDEISNTSLSMQAKLLRVIQEKEVNMIGSNKSQKIDIRIIATSNIDPLELVKKGTFREDLYYRLNVIPIHIPPIRERGEDILLLTSHFAKKYAEETGKKAPVFSDEVIKVFSNYYWPGNVRELENLVHRIVVMSDEKIIRIPDLPAGLHYSATTGNNLLRPLCDVEKEHISIVLELVGGNKTEAAKILKIDRKTLREKLK